MWNYQYHFGDYQDHRVDIIYHSGGFKVAGIDISTKSKIDLADFKNLENLAELCGNRFISGVILYDGDTVYRHQDKFFAVPISALWN